MKSSYVLFVEKENIILLNFPEVVNIQGLLDIMSRFIQIARAVKHNIQANVNLIKIN